MSKMSTWNTRVERKEKLANDPDNDYGGFKAPERMFTSLLPVPPFTNQYLGSTYLELQADIITNWLGVWPLKNINMMYQIDKIESELMAGCILKFAFIICVKAPIKT